jgi:hypothetical protein
MRLIILDITTLVGTFERSLYTIPLMIVLNIIFLIIAYGRRSKEKWKTLFIIYGITAILQDFISTFVLWARKLLIEDPQIINLTNDLSVSIFIPIEFTIFYSFFYYQFSQRRTKKLIVLTGKIYCLSAFIISLLIFFFEPNNTLKIVEGYLSVTASILILIPSFYYFYTLFTTPPDKNLLHEPSFWITTGIAFLHGLNIPVFLLYTFFINEYTLYSINYIAYCILFILFIISLLCNKKQKSVSTARLKGLAGTL